MIELCLQKQFGKRRHPFRLDVDYVINDEQKCTILFGPSGSGKTLTLHCLVGLTEPDSGRIAVDGFVLYDSRKKILLPTRDRNIGYMFQDYALFPNLTVLQNIAYPHSHFFPFFISPKEREICQDLLEHFAIGQLTNRYPSELSGGQRQRVALVRALNAHPRLLLLDEPFSALDPLLRGQLRKELFDILTELNLKTIIITHDPDDVDCFSGQLILYDNGKARPISDYDKLRARFDTTTDCLLHLQREAQNAAVS